MRLGLTPTEAWDAVGVGMSFNTTGDVQLGKHAVFTAYCVTRQAFGTYGATLAPRTVNIGAESATNSDQQ
jgi:hypothetical protein